MTSFCKNIGQSHVKMGRSCCKGLTPTLEDVIEYEGIFMLASPDSKPYAQAICCSKMLDGGHRLDPKPDNSMPAEASLATTVIKFIEMLWHGHLGLYLSHEAVGYVKPAERCKQARCEKPATNAWNCSS